VNERVSRGSEESRGPPEERLRKGRRHRKSRGSKGVERFERFEKTERIERTAEQRVTVVNEETERTYIAEAFDHNRRGFRPTGSRNWECSDEDVRRIKELEDSGDLEDEEEERCEDAGRIKDGFDDIDRGWVLVAWKNAFQHPQKCQPAAAARGYPNNLL
jgi:hypothetical protein